MPTDRRYRWARWRTVRLRVLERDGHRCRIVLGCREPGTVADHIHPVYPGMPDAEFFDLLNLRAACQGHNIARGFATVRPSRVKDEDVVTGDYT